MNYHSAFSGTNDCREKFTAPGTIRRSTAETRTGLYLLSYLLTADRAKAEQCMVPGLDLPAEDSAAFRDWADSWARRRVVTNALRLIAPHPETGRFGTDLRGPG